MEHDAAVNLIRNEYISPGPSRWADLGAGDGTFTRALADLLSESSVIEAIDQNQLALEKIPSVCNGVVIEKKISDLTFHDFYEETYDGIIIANTLHFFQHPMPLLSKITRSLKKSGVLVIVEYEVSTSSRWIPYPIGFQSLKTCLRTIGFGRITKLRDHPSIYGGRSMYCAVATRDDRVEFQQQEWLA